MKTTRRVPLKKENSTDNYYKDSFKPRPISSSPKKTTTSQSRIPIPLPKMSKSRPESLKISPDNIEKMEGEIEAKIRLQLNKEYIQRYHLLQDKYDEQIFKSSSPLDSSFINNLTALFSIQQQNQFSYNYLNNQCQIEEEEEQDEYEYEYEYVNEDQDNDSNNDKDVTEMKKIEKEIEIQKQKQRLIKNEIEKNTQILLKINKDLTDSLDCQNQLQKEQQTISNQIEEAYIRNSNLFIELNTMKEQKQFEMQFNDMPETFDGNNNLIDYKYPYQITQGKGTETKSPNQVSTKLPFSKRNSESIKEATQNQTTLNSFEITSQPLINLSTDSDDDPMLLYLNQNPNSPRNNNIQNDSLDEDSLDENDDDEISNNSEDLNDNDDQNACATKSEYTCHVEDYIMTDEEVLTYTTKYEEQKQFTLETMIETQEESTTIVETFELKPNNTNLEEEEIDDNFDDPVDNYSDAEDEQEFAFNNKKDNIEDDLNSNELPKELFRSPYRIKIPIRSPKK